MATVKVHYDKSAREMQNYLKEKRGRDELTTEQLCSLEDLKKDFTGLQQLYNSKGNNSIHLIQSWSPKESSTLKAGLQ
jgi:hypothetical protein